MRSVSQAYIARHLPSVNSSSTEDFGYNNPELNSVYTQFQQKVIDAEKLIDEAAEKDRYSWGQYSS